MKDLDRKIKELFQGIPIIVSEVLTEELTALGNECNERIRNGGHGNDWQNRTGNLRRSIGYAIFDHAREVVSSSFDTVLQGSAGSAEGKRFVESLASLYSDTFALVVVAGMDYSGYVEAKGFDVLESSRLLAMSKMDSLIARADGKIQKRIEQLSKRLGLD